MKKGLIGWIVLLLIIAVILGIITLSITLNGSVIGIELNLTGVKNLTSVI